MKTSWTQFFDRPAAQAAPPPDPEAARYGLVSSLFADGVEYLDPSRRYVLGRDPQAEVVVPGDTVSRQHAEIIGMPDGGFVLRDLGSKNRTYVNGRAIDTHLLKEGDRIQIASFKIDFRETKGVQEVRRRRPRHEAIADAFEGSELLPLCRLIETNRREGRLVISRGAIAGSLDFRRGRIVKARLGLVPDEEAARLLLHLARGIFRFTARPVARGRVEVRPTALFGSKEETGSGPAPSAEEGSGPAPGAEEGSGDEAGGDVGEATMDLDPSEFLGP